MTQPVLELDLPGLGKFNLNIAADVAIQDLDMDMAQIAPLVSWYGRLLAAARQEVDHLEACVRLAKAQKRKGLFDYDPKIAEWKANAEVESDVVIAELLVSARRAWYVANTLSAAFDALKIKADILRSKSAMARAELERT